MTLRVALLGYGLAGEAFHGPLIHCTPGMELAAIVTSNTERAAQAQSRYPAVHIFDTAQELWAEASQFDLAVIATPNRTHVPLAEQALGAGLPVVVDKPFAPTAEQARRLFALAKSAGLLLTVFQNRRWDGDFLTLRSLLKEEKLGAISRFESRFERWRPIPKPGWRQSAEPEEAGGLLYDLGSHLIDQATELFGPVAQVYAELDQRHPSAQVDDDAFVALTHRSGVRSHLWMSSMAAHLGPRMRVLGTRAAYTKYGLDVQEASLRQGQQPDQPGWGEEPEKDWGTLGAGEQETLVPTLPGNYPEFYASVYRALCEGGAPPVDPQEAIDVLTVIEAARRSAAERQLILL